MEDNQKGWVKLHRSILEWEWYDDNNTFKVFIHCLLRANHKEQKWRGQVIEKGSFITSYSNLANECKLTTQQVRTSLNKLKKTNEVTIKTTNKNTYVTVCKYDSYQVLENTNNNQSNKQITNKQQTNNKQVTTNKNVNNIKNNNNTIDYKKLILFFNQTTGKSVRVVNDKTKKQIQTRLKEGYTKEDITLAIKNCANDNFHKDNNLKYLTLEFITRADKLETYSSMKAKKELTFQQKIRGEV